MEMTELWEKLVSLLPFVVETIHFLTRGHHHLDRRSSLVSQWGISISVFVRRGYLSSSQPFALRQTFLHASLAEHDQIEIKRAHRYHFTMN